jgi:hypothetical protein
MLFMKMIALEQDRQLTLNFKFNLSQIFMLKLESLKRKQFT